MIEKKDIKKMVAHIIKRDKGIADTNIMHPSREWFTGLSLAILIVIFGSWFCWYLYSAQTLKMQAEVTVVESVVPYQAVVVQNALDLFAAKQKRFAAIVGGGSTPETLVGEESATSTPEIIATEPEVAVPELIIDPPPLFSDEEASSAGLAP